MSKIRPSSGSDVNELMSERYSAWSCVAQEINQRMIELDLSQGELAMRARVSSATVREIQWHTAERRRSPNILAALSIALDWPPEYIADIVARGPAARRRLMRSE